MPAGPFSSGQHQRGAMLAAQESTKELLPARSQLAPLVQELFGVVHQEQERARCLLQAVEGKGKTRLERGHLQEGVRWADLGEQRPKQQIKRALRISTLLRSRKLTEDHLGMRWPRRQYLHRDPVHFGPFAASLRTFL